MPSEVLIRQSHPNTTKRIQRNHCHIVEAIIRQESFSRKTEEPGTLPVDLGVIRVNDREIAFVKNRASQRTGIDLRPVIN
jgi:hypothetical protein